jgi:hypothetical protein
MNAAVEVVVVAIPAVPPVGRGVGLAVATVTG